MSLGIFFQIFFCFFSEVASLLIFRVHPFRRACLIVAVCYCCTKAKAEEKLFHCEKCIKYVFNSCCISCVFSGTCKYSKNYLSLFLGKMELVIWASLRIGFWGVIIFWAHDCPGRHFEGLLMSG